eukprot:2354622-Alexandrium_andersonii.AAC.1
MLVLKLKWPRLSAIHPLNDSDAVEVLAHADGLGLVVGGLLVEDVVPRSGGEGVLRLRRSDLAHVGVAE